MKALSSGLPRTFICMLMTTSTMFAKNAARARVEVPDHGLVGAWDLTVTTPKMELPSWIRISDTDGKTQLLMVGITDHAKSLKTFSFRHNKLEFVSPRGEEGFATDMYFEGELIGGVLVGTVKDIEGNVLKWRGVKAPKLARPSVPQWGEAVMLFDGTTLSGWSLLDPSKDGTWKVQDGALISTSHGSDLVYIRPFEDFKLHLEFKCAPSSNSGVYLRGRYELQIETDAIAEPNNQHTGALYGFLDPMPEQPRRPGEWQTFDITLIGRNLTVLQNGITVMDRREIPGITGGALDSHEELPGPIYLQGSEQGLVAFRNIVLTPAIPY